MNVVENIKNSYSRNGLPKRSIGFFPNIIGPRVICGDGMVGIGYGKLLIKPRCVYNKLYNTKLYIIYTFLTQASRLQFLNFDLCYLVTLILSNMH